VALATSGDVAIPLPRDRREYQTENENYLCARWPGDAHALFIALPPAWITIARGE
jgi:hypothetical protein